MTSPSSSPENSFLDEEGRVCSLCEGPAYDRELITSLVTSCIEAQYVLQNDNDFVEELKTIQKQLAPIQVSSDGRIMEWGREYKEAMIHHRHLSHLWGAYPGQMITPEHTKELAEAAKPYMERRQTWDELFAYTGHDCLGWDTPLYKKMQAENQVCEN